MNPATKKTITLTLYVPFLLNDVPRAGANAKDVPARASTVAMIAEKRNMSLKFK